MADNTEDEAVILLYIEKIVYSQHAWVLLYVLLEKLFLASFYILHVIHITIIWVTHNMHVCQTFESSFKLPEETPKNK